MAELRLLEGLEKDILVKVLMYAFFKAALPKVFP